MTIPAVEISAVLACGARLTNPGNLPTNPLPPVETPYVHAASLWIEDRCGTDSRKDHSFGVDVSKDFAFALNAAAIGIAGNAILVALVDRGLPFGLKEWAEAAAVAAWVRDGCSEQVEIHVRIFDTDGEERLTSVFDINQIKILADTIHGELQMRSVMKTYSPGPHCLRCQYSQACPALKHTAENMLYGLMRGIEPGKDSFSLLGWCEAVRRKDGSHPSIASDATVGFVLSKLLWRLTYVQEQLNELRLQVATALSITGPLPTGRGTEIALKDPKLLTFDERPVRKES